MLKNSNSDGNLGILGQHNKVEELMFDKQQLSIMSGL